MAFYPGDRPAEERYEPVSRHGPFHAAIATPLGIEEVLEIGRRFGCRTSRCQRGSWFRIVEFWIDDSQMLELLTPEMQREYQRSVTLENWRATLADRGIDADGEPVGSAEA